MEFMHYYRDVFPEASIKPKLHILEDYIFQRTTWLTFCGTGGYAFSKSPMNTTDVHAQTTSDITGHN